MIVTKMHHIYQLTFLPGFFPVNCYLIEEEAELTLIDTGIPSSYKGILKEIDKCKKPLTNILLTHAHDDHVGALDELKNRIPHVTVSISERDNQLLRGDVSLHPDEPQTPIKGGVPKKLTTRADKLLKDGERIGSLQAISTPGHTPGSMSFLDTRNRTLIAGDAMQTRGGMAVSGQIRPLFPFPAFATWNKAIAIQSVKKLLQFNPSLLAVGHGDMIKDPCEKIQAAVNKAEKNAN